MKTNTTTAPHFSWGETCDGWWLKQDGAFSVIEEVMPPGTFEVRHFHRSVEQFFYVLDGELQIESGENIIHLGQNEGLTIVPRTPHCARNTSILGARFLVVSSPDRPNDRVEMPS